MPVIPKIAGVAGIVSSLQDVHKTAEIYSKQEYNKAMGDSIVSCSIGNQKADYVSAKDAQRKNWSNRMHIFSGVNEATGAMKGYLKGAILGLARYTPKFILSVLAIVPKENKVLAYLSAAALGGLEIGDFLKNGTGLFEKTDYLKRD